MDISMRKSNVTKTTKSKTMARKTAKREWTQNYSKDS